MKRQQNQNTREITRGVALGLGLAFLLAAPAVSAEIYAWRTEDGGYAYTDDRDQIPPRYASQAKLVRSRSLGDYERFTPQDAAAGQDYATKLAARLERVRALNAAGAPAPVRAAAAPAVAGSTIAFATGDPRAPEIQVPTGNGTGPIVVEPVLAKQNGDFRTRRVTVIRQGDETLAVIKGTPHHFNPVDDIYDEDELVDGVELD